jgi:hypothetical protein
MNQELTQYFVEQGTDIFKFLTLEHSFAPPSVEVEERIDFVTVTFMGKNLAVELILDQRAEDITCKIARVFNGKNTHHYAVDENRVKVREGVFSYLLRKGITETIFTKVTGLSLRERIPITFSDLAKALKKYGGDILKDSPTALTDVPPEKNPQGVPGLDY